MFLVVVVTVAGTSLAGGVGDALSSDGADFYVEVFEGTSLPDGLTDEINQISGVEAAVEYTAVGTLEGGTAVEAVDFATAEAELGVELSSGSAPTGSNQIALATSETGIPRVTAALPTGTGFTSVAEDAVVGARVEIHGNRVEHAPRRRITTVLGTLIPVVTYQGIALASRHRITGVRRAWVPTVAIE